MSHSAAAAHRRIQPLSLNITAVPKNNNSSNNIRGA